MDEICSSSEQEHAEKIEQYQNFIDRGFCTVRRTAKFWSGNFTDMTIEQDLMRLIKVTGSIIDRGFNAAMSQQFISRIPVTYDICQSIEEFCGVKFVTSDQHVDARDSRISAMKIRDNADMKKFSDFFECHEPFPFHESIKSIVTGIIGGDTINCYKARELGQASLEKMIGTPFHKLTLKRRDRIIPLIAVHSKIKIQDNVIAVDPMLLFQRICVTKQSEEELKEHFKWELSPYPLLLFLDGALRKTVKSALFSLFAPEDS
ncbi:hypothetical protein ALC57_16837 [Trachymyrmex cornetzi]|uniref:Uncharacterized protein n=1 Tax=Trachymyrmex cornetzi TaxID=471704 RepID=A0A151IU97_9HYME|nr:hypothetical protein ALC57_16837 [Trachymyrmex cornetzi]